MNSRERVLGAFNRTGYDRIPVKHEGTPEINQMIMDHFGMLPQSQLLIF
jgi:uroporphyrinogen decarboxylase